MQEFLPYFLTLLIGYMLTPTMSNLLFEKVYMCQPEVEAQLQGLLYLVADDRLVGPIIPTRGFSAVFGSRTSLALGPMAVVSCTLKTHEEALQTGSITMAFYLAKYHVQSLCTIHQTHFWTGFY